MNSACWVYYYHDGDYHDMMVHRRGDNGGDSDHCESCLLTEAEAWLVVEWAKEVLNNKTHSFVGMSPWAWTIFLPERVVAVRPLEVTV